MIKSSFQLQQKRHSCHKEHNLIALLQTCDSWGKERHWRGRLRGVEWPVLSPRCGRRRRATWPWLQRVTSEPVRCTGDEQCRQLLIAAAPLLASLLMTIKSTSMTPSTDSVTVLCCTRHKTGILEIFFPANLLASTEKQNPIQQNQETQEYKLLS